MPRHEFETLAKQLHSGRSFRTASRWSQFVTLAMAQLAGRISLRDIVENVSAQAHRLYHLGSTMLLMRFSHLGIGADVASLSLIELWALYCFYPGLGMARDGSKPFATARYGEG